jgi:hypothetical protein
MICSAAQPIDDVALVRICEHDAHRRDTAARKLDVKIGEAERGAKSIMNSKMKFLLGILTALAMLGLTYLVPRGSALRDAQLVQFPVTVGVWAIFVLLFVKLK